jgi:Domain of unknown function (DUF5667)
MSERERLLERCLAELDAGRLTIDQCVRQFAANDPDLAHLLRTIWSARAVTTSAAREAKARVRARLLEEMDADGAAQPIRSAPSPVADGVRGPSRPRSVRAGMRPGRALAAIAAAALLAFGLAGWGAGRVAAAALPGDPLYGVKRAQEWVAYTTAPSDERRGVVLAATADHRLSEAASESVLGHQQLASSLVAEFDGDMRQAIALSAAMAAHGENNRMVLAAVASELARAVQIQQEAAGHGRSGFAQHLGASLNADNRVIQDKQLQLPDISNQDGKQEKPTQVPGADGRGPRGHPTVTPTPPAPGTTPSGGGKGQGGGGH